MAECRRICQRLRAAVASGLRQPVACSAHAMLKKKRSQPTVRLANVGNQPFGQGVGSLTSQVEVAGKIRPADRLQAINGVVVIARVLFIRGVPVQAH